MEKRVDHLVSWIRQQVNDAGLNGALVGVSGGIDSAVVAYLIKRAFPDDSIGVILPINQRVEDQKDAIAVVEGANLKKVGIELTESYQTTYNEIQEQLQANQDWNEENAQLNGANLQARLRMSTLYSVAANYGYLVVGTDNAPEHYTGYFTKYGDGGVDLVPLIHMTKGEVREMARYLGVPSQVVEKKPSAELWEGQTDEEEMGVSYDTIDAYMKGEQVAEKDKEIIEALHKKSAHKRIMPAEPPKFE
ncbi:NAD(+) synthase [Thalassobacillus devorans]|uniref:NAD(+) synthase n=1 Tax=Thalassobacillus devorans TaxID=279813 RepID=UPI00048DE9C9|nr:NAD(+) synthase [Thalassobacillus devorans]